MTLYMASFSIEGGEAPDFELDGALWPLQDDLYLVRSDLSQSKVYHRIKWQLPKDTPLVVATLAEAPKFKGMAKGSLKWVRQARES